MPAFWLVLLSLPGFGILVGLGVMYAVSRLIGVDWAGYIAGVLAINLVLDLALVRVHRRGLGSPSAHEQVGRVCRVVHAGDGHARVVLDGVRWRAESDYPLRVGQHAEVVARRGLTLVVVPFALEEEGARG